MGGGSQPQLPGVPAGTRMLIPGAQLHGVQVRHAISAHCCSGVNGDGPAHGTAGEPHGSGISLCDSSSGKSAQRGADSQSERCEHRRPRSVAANISTHARLPPDRRTLPADTDKPRRLSAALIIDSADSIAARVKVRMLG